MSKRILFICTGNTCRSPLAEYLLRHKAKDLFEVQSAGLAALPGQDASPQVIQLLQERNIKVDHRSQSVTPELMAWADLILTMTETHEHTLKREFPDRAEHIRGLKAYVQAKQDDQKNPNVFDPFGGTPEIYAQTLQELESLIDALIEKEKEK